MGTPGNTPEQGETTGPKVKITQANVWMHDDGILSEADVETMLKAARKMRENGYPPTPFVRVREGKKKHGHHNE